MAHKLQEFKNEVVESGGLIEHVKVKTAIVVKSTLHKVDEVYKTAKKKISESYQVRIQMLHERLRGGEPIERDGDMYIQADMVIFKDIEMSLYHALPPSFRQFEKRLNMWLAHMACLTRHVYCICSIYLYK